MRDQQWHRLRHRTSPLSLSPGLSAACWPFPSGRNVCPSMCFSIPVFPFCSDDLTSHPFFQTRTTGRLSSPFLHPTMGDPVLQCQLSPTVPSLHALRFLNYVPSHFPVSPSSHLSSFVLMESSFHNNNNNNNINSIIYWNFTTCQALF